MGFCCGTDQNSQEVITQQPRSTAPPVKSQPTTSTPHKEVDEINRLQRKIHNLKLKLVEQNVEKSTSNEQLKLELRAVNCENKKLLEERKTWSEQYDDIIKYSERQTEEKEVTIQRLQEKINGLQLQIDKQPTNRNEDTSTIQQLKYQLEVEKSDRIKLLQLSKQNENTVKQLNVQLEIKEAENKRLQNESYSLKFKLDTLNVGRQQDAIAIERTQLQLETEKAKNQTLLEEREILSMRETSIIKQLKSHIETRETENKILQNENHDLKFKFNTLNVGGEHDATTIESLILQLEPENVENKKLLREREILSKQETGTIKQLKSQIETKEVNGTLQHKNDDQKFNLDTINDRQQKDTTIETLKLQLEAEKAENLKLLHERDMLSKQEADIIKQLEVQVEIKKIENRTLQNENDVLKFNLDAINVDTQQKDTSIETLKLQLEMKKDENLKLLQETDMLLKQKTNIIEELEYQIERKDVEIQHLLKNQVLLEQRDEENVLTENENNSYERTSNVQMSFPDVSEKRFLSNKDEQNENTHLELEKRQLEIDLRNSTATSNKLKIEIGNMQSKLNAKDADIRKAGIRIKELEMKLKIEQVNYNDPFQRNTSSQQSNSSTENELRTLKEKLTSAEKEVQQLRFENGQIKSDLHDVQSTLNIMQLNTLQSQMSRPESRKISKDIQNVEVQNSATAHSLENIIKQLNERVTIIRETVDKQNPVTFEDIMEEERSLYKKQTVQFLNTVREKLDEYEENILRFSGKNTDKTYLHVQEMLYRCTSTLDNMQNLRDNKELKERRKMLITRINKLEGMLESKTSQN